MLILWCEIERAERQITTHLEALEQEFSVAHSVGEARDALLDYPEAAAVLASFVGVPLPHAQAACRRLLTEFAERRLHLIGVLEAEQMEQFDPRWGLEDVLLFPVERRELAARLRLLDWRVRAAPEEGARRIGPVVVDTARHEVLAEGRPVNLTVKEYELLLLFTNSRERVLTRQAILDEVWGRDYYGGERTVDVHVRRLRAKLPQVAAALETVHGVGYRFTPERISS